MKMDIRAFAAKAIRKAWTINRDWLFAYDPSRERRLKMGAASPGDADWPDG